MKLLALLCLIGFAAGRSGTEFGWKPQMRYTFEYRGRMLTGLPKLASHYSGIAMWTTVVISVHDQPDTISMEIENPYYVHMSQELEPQVNMSVDGTNWRNLLLPEMQPVPAPMLTTLKSPVVFHLSPETGEILSLTLSKQEPEWSINHKKALLVLFQTKVDPKMFEGKWNRLASETPTYWKVKEESLDGECETTYQVNKLPKWTVIDHPDIFPAPERCTAGGEDYWEIVRTRDLDSCTKSAIFRFYKPGAFRCDHTDGTMANCGNMWSRSSITRYIGCGSRAHGGEIQAVINEGEMNQNIMGYKSERIVTGTMQVLKLKHVDHAITFPQPRDPITFKSLFYEYTKEPQVQQPYTEGSYLEMGKSEVEGRIPWRMWKQDPKILAQVLPRTHMLSQETGSEWGAPSDDVKSQIKHQMQTVANNLVQGSDIAEQQHNLKVLSIARGFSFMSQAKILDLYNSMVGGAPNSLKRDVLQNIFYDAVFMCGTPESVKFVKEMITQRKISQTQLINFYLYLPHYLITPDQDILEIIYSTIDEGLVTENKLTHNTAITGFSRLLELACMSPNRKVSYPVAVFGEMCHSDSKILQETWIPYLVQHLKQADTSDKNIYITALGMLPHKNVIVELIPYVDNSVPHLTELNRLLAVFSLSHVGHEDPNLVTPVLMSLFTNQEESTDIRISAFTSLMKMNPPTTVFQRIAITTREERHMDQELLKTINTGLYTLGYFQQPEMQADEKLNSMASKARAAYSLIRKVKGILPTSGAWYSGDFLKRLNVGYESIISYIASQSNFLPKNMYVKINYFLDEYQLTTFDAGLRLKGIETLWQKLPTLLAPPGEESKVAEEIRNTWSTEWKRIWKRLNMEMRESQHMDTAVALRVLESSPLFYNMDSMSIEKLKMIIQPYLSNPTLLKEKLEGLTHLRFQRFVDMVHDESLIPSEMGLPIHIEMHAPVMVSLLGDMNLKPEQTTPSLELRAKLVYSAQHTGWVGTTCPFTNDYIVTGINGHTSLNLPGKINLKVDVPAQSIQISMKPDTESPSQWSLLHYHVRPYTVIKKVTDLSPMTEGQSYKLIKSKTPLQKVKYEFGDYLGVKLGTEILTESRFIDGQFVYEILDMYKMSPVNLLAFGFISPALTEFQKPSVRRHDYTITFDPVNSPTKELIWEFKVGCATKSSEDKSFMYHTLQLGSNGGYPDVTDIVRQPVYTLLKRFLPYNIVHKNLEEARNVHPTRVQLMRNSISNMEIESGVSVSMIWNIILKGNKPQTYKFATVVSSGTNEHSTEGKISQKWNWHWENPFSDTTKMVCVDGGVTLPILPMWNINDRSLAEVSYTNYLGFGTTCEESTIKIQGSAKVNQEQKDYSLKSPEGQECMKMVQQQVPGAKTSEVCKTALLQAKTLNEVVFENKYINVPTYIKTAEEIVINYLKMYWWPYYSLFGTMEQGTGEYSTSGAEGMCTYNTKTSFIFKPDTPSFDLILSQPKEVVKFSDVHVPYPYNLFYPLKVGVNNIELAKEQLYGVSGVCKIDTRSIVTFDNITLGLKLDDCPHLMAADCTDNSMFAISVKADQSTVLKEVKILLKKHSILLGYTSGKPTVTINQHEAINLVTGKTTPLIVEGFEVAKALMTPDYVLVITAPQYELNELTYDGKHLVISPSSMKKGKLCGLCGDFNYQVKADVTGPQKCVYSSPEIKMASYRLSSECTPLPRDIQQRLQYENQHCTKFEVLPTKLSKAFKGAAGKCLVTLHSTILRPGEVCISKVPVTQCGPTCKAKRENNVEKNVQFVCTEEGRLAELYKKRIASGQYLNELRGMKTTFTTKVTQPSQCEHAAAFRGL